MKKNRLFVLGIITMFVAILSLTLVSGTMARYTSSITGSDTARVAKWSVTAEGTDAVTNDIFTFDLFNTVKDTNGAPEEEVKVGATETIIAPGTSGEFILDLANASEVTTDFVVQFNVTKNGVPLKFKVDGGEWTDSLAQLTGTLKYANDADDDQKSFTIQWKWDYETSDAQNTADTALGKDGTIKVTVEAVVTFTQKD